MTTDSAATIVPEDSPVIIAPAIGVASGGPGIALQPILPGLTFDVPLLPALSSSHVRMCASAGRAREAGIGPAGGHRGDLDAC